MNKQHMLRTAVGIVATASMLMTGTAFAAQKDLKTPGRGVGHVLQARTQKGNQVAGKVTAVNGTSFTVSRPGMKGGAVVVFTVNTSSTTTFLKDGKPATLADVSVNEMLMVSGTVDTATSTITATNVRINTLPLKKENDFANRVAGKVTAVDGTSFTVSRLPMKKGGVASVVTVNTSGTTTYTKDGKPATFADVTANEMLMVSGVVDTATSTVSATSVRINTMPPKQQKMQKAPGKIGAMKGRGNHMGLKVKPAVPQTP